jgi:rsbT co-antagonist protein RsbR
MTRSKDANITGVSPADIGGLRRADEDELLPQLVAHLREHRTTLRQDWAGRIQSRRSGPCTYEDPHGARS